MKYRRKKDKSCITTFDNKTCFDVKVGDLLKKVLKNAEGKRIKFEN